MTPPKENKMTPDAAVATSQNPAQAQPTTADTRSVWATPTPPKKSAATAGSAELEARFEAMRSRNWITERMVQQYQNHWHCTREEALERLLAKTAG
jgi:hypothetical protein